MIPIGVVASSGAGILVPNKVALTGVEQTANTTLNVTWTAPASNAAPIDYYQVQISYDGISYGNLTTTSALNSGTSGYTYDVTYWFRVSAVNAYGSGEYSDPSTGMVQNFGPGYWD